MNQSQKTFKAKCDLLRDQCLRIEQSARGLTPSVSELPEGVEFQEINADLMLAVRHLEDARMRFGKAIQWACGGGVSCFDAAGGPQVVQAPSWALTEQG